MKLSARLHVLNDKYEPLADEELMQLIQSGDKLAVAALYERYKTSVYNLLVRVVPSKEVAEELTAETFITIFSKSELYDPAQRFKTWLWTIARRKGIDHLRKKKEFLYEDRRTSDQDEDSPHTLDFYAHEESTPEALFLEKSEKNLVNNCFEKLPLQQREMLSMRLFAEESYAQIAEAFQKTESNIKTLLFRAREALKKCVEGQMQDDEMPARSSGGSHE
jgi:RNA polymerase sigma-70 factor (ECF subfamily)